MMYGGSRKACMKYPSPPQPYMTLKSGLEIPENKELSILDIKALKKLYKPPTYLNAPGKICLNFYKLFNRNQL